VGRGSSTPRPPHLPQIPRLARLAEHRRPPWRHSRLQLASMLLLCETVVAHRLRLRRCHRVRAWARRPSCRAPTHLVHPGNRHCPRACGPRSVQPSAPRRCPKPWSPCTAARTQAESRPGMRARLARRLMVCEMVRRTERGGRRRARSRAESRRPHPRRPPEATVGASPRSPPLVLSSPRAPRSFRERHPRMARARHPCPSPACGAAQRTRS